MVQSVMQAPTIVGDTSLGVGAALVFWFAAVVAVLAGVAVFSVNSMARATYALALSFVAVGVAVLTMHQGYVGVVVVLMMVMEMAVMALYMVMFMGMNPALMKMSMARGRKGALAASVATFVVLGSGAVLIPWPDRRSVPVQDLTRALGEALMGSHMLVMMAVSAVMVTTIVAGVVLSSKRTRYDRLGDDLDQRPARDPQPGGVGR